MSTAARLFADAGFATVTMADIGAACGISGPALYHHFDSKEGLLGEMLVSISEHLLRGAEDIVELALPPAAALRQLIKAHTRFATTRPELITVQFRDLVHASDQDQRRVRRLQRRYVEIWVEVVTDAEPDVAAAQARTAVHAAFGLLNSTAHAPSNEAVLSELAWRVLDPAALACL